MTSAALLDQVASARTILFVPGSRPERFAKALASGADCIVIDLEDAVGAENKDEARHNVRRWRAAGGAGIVRVNDATSQWYDDDLAVLGSSPSVVMMPKVNDADQVTATMRRLSPGSAIVPILETAAGISNARNICAADGVLRAAFGNGDLALELGIDHADRVALLYARSALVMASAAGRIAAPLDGVTTSIDDDQQLSDDARHGMRLGYTGKLCIHPRQIPIVNVAYTPSASDLERARRVVEAARGEAVAVVDGRMIDRPIVDRARRLLERRSDTQDSLP